MKDTLVGQETMILGFSTNEIIKETVSIGTKIFIAVAILVIGLWITKKIVKKIQKILKKRDMDEGLRTFLTSLTSIGLKTLIVIVAIGELGFEMTSVVAILGAASFAIGMAFSGALSNFAGGIMILIFKPYKVGDYISAQGEEGVVSEIQIFNTVLNTLDNKVVIIPNGPLSTGNITNFTKSELRRVDTVVGIGYGEDFRIAKSILEKVVAENDLILTDPEPFIGITDLGDSSVNLTVRVWSKTEDYWDVFFFMNQRVLEEIEGTEGISIPYPHEVQVNP